MNSFKQRLCWIIKNYNPSSLKNLNNAANIIDKVNDYDVVSLDVFDTLVRKRVEPASLIRNRVSEYISELLVKSGIHINPVTVLEERTRCEDKLKRQSISSGNDGQFCLKNCIVGTLKAIKCENIISPQSIVDFEVTLEQKATEQMPGADTLLDLLKSSGKRVICISDAYLSADQIAEILENCGLFKYIDKLYISSDIGLSKSTGRLFQHVVKNEGRNIIHIGDNFLSDYIEPAKLGIKSLWLYDKNEHKRRKTLRDFVRKNQKLKQANAIIRNGKSFENKQQMYEFGYNTLGPPLTVFTHYIIEQAKKDKVDKIYFLARDGYVTKKIWGILSSNIYNSETLPSSHYMCISRLSVMLPTISENDFDKTSSFSSQEKETFLKQRDEAKQLLKEYLLSIGFLGKQKVALVDSISSGVTRDRLDQAFENDKNYPVIQGYYFVLGQNSIPHSIDKPKDMGIIGDFLKVSTREATIFSSFACLNEFLAYPNHGVTVGYKKDKNKITPVFRKTEQEKQWVLTNFALNGILDYARDYAKYYRLFNFKPSELINDIRDSIRKTITCPSKKDAELLKGLFMTATWPYDHNQYLVRKTGWADLVSIRGIITKLSSSIWFQGTLKSSAIPGLYCIYCVIVFFRKGISRIKKQ